MTNRFRNILLPVDFSVNTNVAIDKALELSREGATTFHLFHIQRIVVTGSLHYLHQYVSGYSLKEINAARKETELKLARLKSEIEKNNQNISVITWVGFGQPIQEAIAEKAKTLNADLIIIGKHSHHSFFPFLNTVIPGKLAAKVKIPVLMAKPGSLNKEIKTVVIPVGNRYPGKKLEMLEALRRKTHINVRLVTFLSDETDPSYSRQSILNAFRSLKSQFFSAVECEVLKGNNKGKTLLNYCKRVGADVLIVHPDTETRIGGWVNRQISDVLPADSGIQVLSIQSNF